MQNVIVAIFEDEGKAYQVLSELKTRAGQATVLEAAVVQNNGGYILVKDGWTNADNTDNWMAGGLIGGVVGILGGPLGMLLGAGLGMVVGDVVDVDTLEDFDSVTEQVAASLGDGHLGLIVIAEEPDMQELDGYLRQFGATRVIRRDVPGVLEEIYQAEEATKKLRKEARAHMREDKARPWREKAQQAADTVKADFEKVKQKLTS